MVGYEVHGSRASDESDTHVHDLWAWRGSSISARFDDPVSVGELLSNLTPSFNRQSRPPRPDAPTLTDLGISEGAVSNAATVSLLIGASARCFRKTPASNVPKGNFHESNGWRVVILSGVRQ